MCLQMETLSLEIWDNVFTNGNSFTGNIGLCVHKWKLLYWKYGTRCSQMETLSHEIWDYEFTNENSVGSRAGHVPTFLKSFRSVLERGASA